jgi:antitoxin component YwqK of YwqJK toxin-antitoxin module
MQRNFILFILAFVLFSCNQKKPFESIEETYPDGTSKLIKYYKSEAKEVLVKEIHYYEDGQKKMEGGFKNDARDGQWSYWYPDGKPWSQAVYTEGVPNGLKTVWHETGHKYYEGNMSDNKRVGIWKFWDKNGTFIKEINYDKTNI